MMHDLGKVIIPLVVKFHLGLVLICEEIQQMMLWDWGQQ